MNFQELMQRMHELDQPVIEEPNEGNAYGQAVQNTPPGEEIKIDGKGTGDIKREEDLTNECGMGPMDSMKQNDSVSMNVNMNGSGAGGIRDLLDILKNLDGGSGEHGDAHDLGALIKGMDEPSAKVAVMGRELPIDEFANEPDEMYGSVDDVIPTGNDMHSKGAEAEKVNGGGNPMGVDEEALLARLSSLYEQIKNQ